jgi:hypothetical protein
MALRKPVAGDLAMRDPARAALMGALPGSNFGGESTFGGEFSGDPFGADPFGAIGADPFGAVSGDDMGDEYGADDFGAAAPPKAALVAAWKNRQMQQRMTVRRKLVLQPNAGSRDKIERYSFSLVQTLTIGTAVALAMTNTPSTRIRPQRAVFNAPTVGFCTIDRIEVGNINSLVGSEEDAFTYGPQSQGVFLDLPTMETSTRASVSGLYTGIAPAPLSNGQLYKFIATFQGPAELTA